MRIRQKRMSNVADSGEEHSIIWGMFMAATMNAATFMGKNFMDNENSIKNSTDLTLKHMFDISEKLVTEQEEINNVDKNLWGKNSWTHLSLIGDETIISLQSTKVYVFSDSVVVPREDPSISRFQRSLEEQSCGSTSKEKLQRLWCYQWRVDWIRAEHFPRIHNVAALR